MSKLSFIPPGPWSTSKISLVLAVSYTLIVLLVPGIALALLVANDKPDEGFRDIFAFLAILIVAYALWLIWVAMAAWLLAARGNTKILASLPIFYGSLAFLAVMPGAWVAAHYIWSIALAVALALAGIGFLLTVIAQRKISSEETARLSGL